MSTLTPHFPSRRSLGYRASPPSNCSEIGPASVAAIVGHPVPLGTYFSNAVKGTKQNDEKVAALVRLAEEL
jgi:hypothetical protein